MEQELYMELKEHERIRPLPKKLRFPENLPKINIAYIGAAGFHRHLTKKEEGTEMFVTSIHEIDRIIEETSAVGQIGETKPNPGVGFV